MAFIGKKVFTLKSSGAQLYKWSPLPNDLTKKTASNSLNNNAKPYYCSALPNSQGQDWITTYVYNFGIVNNQQAHLAYVECDYVQ